MRFLADMRISWRTTRWLAECGHDAVHLVEQGLEKASDQEIVDKAVAEQRVILTMDLDFPHLYFEPAQKRRAELCLSPSDSVLLAPT